MFPSRMLARKHVMCPSSIEGLANAVCIRPREDGKLGGNADHEQSRRKALI